MATATDQVSVVCACGKRLNAPSSAAGKRARCPACKEVVVLPAATAPAAVGVDTWPQTLDTPAPAVAQPRPVGKVAPARPAISIHDVSDLPQEDDDDRMGALYDLADAEMNAPVPVSNGIYCPQCRSGMEPHAVLCTNCGYDTRTGRSLGGAARTTAAAPAKKGPPPFIVPKKPGKPVDYMAPTGSLALGIVFSAVFALVASILWVVVAWATHLAIGYIAILIGIAAGIGMQVGHKGYSQMGGVVAALMTIVAIFTAKFVVLQILLASLGGRAILHINLAMYYFRPMSLIIVLIGVGAAYRTASGTTRG